MTSKVSNKIFKVLLFISALFLVLSYSSLVASAADRDDLPNSELQPQEELGSPTETQYSTPTEDGGTILFESEEDYQSYQNDNISATCNQTTQTTLEKYTVSRAFIGYHPATPGWDKVKSVSIAGGITWSINGSYANGASTFGISFSHSLTATKTYESQYPNKYVRVGVRKDVIYHKVKNVVKNPVGTVINTYITETATPIGDTYTELMYKD
ncbi:hypothetical protein [Lysinibacillus sphaericus]|uniref:Uncharacterized protein n=1 Tax=Lysinibacillus sphaericus OT4b.31 TaxID=1285586 RepID=R7Z9Z1_LYSSH|nr:hypothetical protein [Lysinibacillus sphaericus]EON70933.1 hypothetical protein H131_18182 [Lysinibacillus sphaericus OT4b.31]